MQTELHERLVVYPGGGGATSLHPWATLRFVASDVKSAGSAAKPAEVRIKPFHSNANDNANATADATPTTYAYTLRASHLPLASAGWDSALTSPGLAAVELYVRSARLCGESRSSSAEAEAEAEAEVEVEAEANGGESSPHTADDMVMQFTLEPGSSVDDALRVQRAVCAAFDTLLAPRGTVCLYLLLFFRFFFCVVMLCLLVPCTLKHTQYFCTLCLSVLLC